MTGTTFSALDTTNLRVTFTAPGSGLVVVKFGCSVNGVTSNQSLLAILEASTVLGVVLGIGGALNNQYLIGSKLLTGLTAGSHSYDLALASSSSGTISAHWGGGINASGFGPAFVEIWG